jgi:GT2 family glycosyltransferase
MTYSVVVITLNRPDAVRQCLDCLKAQTPLPDQIILVDGSTDERTKELLAEYPGVLYLRNDRGIGHMTHSRNIALLRATGKIIAFVDDDAFAHAGWAAAILETYADPTVGAVGGRAINNVPGEEKLTEAAIGRITKDGLTMANFAADPGEIIEVDHILGCNMSYRREVLAELGGFREDYPGVSGVCEDTDMSLRVRALRYRILFNPAAVVTHIGAPQAVGKRFDAKYEFSHRRNNFVMLIRNFGPRLIVWRYLAYTSFMAVARAGRKIGGALVHMSANFLGVIVGMAIGFRLWIGQGRDPIRHDAEAQKIAAALRAGEPSQATDQHAEAVRS